MNILITSGPTRAYIDEIRYISNYSTGKLGTLIAEEFLKNGNKVTFIYGKGSLHPDNKNLRLVEVQTVDDLANILKEEFKKKYDVIIHLMAILDYVPDNQLKIKVKSDKKVWNLKLVRTPKIIKLIKRISPKSILVGFKLEYNVKKKKLLKSAIKLIKESKADYIVANDYKNIKRGKHIASILSRNGLIKDDIIGKKNIAKEIVSLTIERRKK
ncbi:MAG: phosphopantothenoylcysteine decarboxylase [Candidatus Firestonebacteria bacterium]